jgi:hypothetical protein
MRTYSSPHPAISDAPIHALEGKKKRSASSSSCMCWRRRNNDRNGAFQDPLQTYPCSSGSLEWISRVGCFRDDEDSLRRNQAVACGLYWSVFLSIKNWSWQSWQPDLWSSFLWTCNSVYGRIALFTLNSFYICVRSSALLIRKYKDDFFVLVSFSFLFLIFSEIDDGPKFLQERSVKWTTTDCNLPTSRIYMLYCICQHKAAGLKAAELQYILRCISC